VALPSESIYDLLKAKGLARAFTDLHGLMHALQNITLYSSPGAPTEYRFFWRGQSNVAWGLQPKLFRNLREKLGRDPTVAEFDAREDQILEAFDRTDLGKGTRSSALIIQTAQVGLHSLEHAERWIIRTGSL